MYGMSDAPPPAPVKAKRSGCEWLAVIVIILLALAAPALQSFVEAIGAHHHKVQNRQTRLITKDLREAILAYKTEHHHFPLPVASAASLDLALRSRGPLLRALIEDAGELNPKKIKFFDLPVAKNGTHGVWVDGEEWILSDTWGEPFYIVLDTDDDGKIANPEYPKGEKHPSPTELPVGVIVYSSGRDRDPKTWRDNICSWRLP